MHYKNRLPILLITLFMATNRLLPQEQPLAKIRVDEKGDVEILEMDGNRGRGKGNPVIQQLSNLCLYDQTAATENDLWIASMSYNFLEPNLIVNVVVGYNLDLILGNVSLDYYLSENPSITDSDTHIKHDVIAIIPCGSGTLPKSAIIDISAFQGTWYVGVIIDKENYFEESNEYNNDCGSPNPLTYIKDLQFTYWDISYDYPDLSLLVGIKNIGTSTASDDAGNVRLDVYLSDNTNIQMSDTHVSTWHFPSLAPNEEKVKSNIIHLSGHEGYEWYVGGIIDQNNDIPEINDNNNKTFNPDILQLLSDLTYVSANCSYSYSDPDLILNLRIINIGNVPSGSFSVDFYLSLDDNIRTSDPHLGSSTLIGLAIDEYADKTRTFDVSTYKGSNWYVGFIINKDDSEPELNGGSNIYYYPDILILEENPELPDLILTSVSVNDYEGPQIGYQYSVKNQGNASTGIGFKSYIYLSTDPCITQFDYKIDEKSCGALNAEATHNSGSIQTTVSGVPEGEYYLGVYADGELVISESDENNNIKSVDLPKVTIPSPSTPLPDLNVTSVSISDYYGPQIAYQYSVKNQGNTGTGSGFKNTIYLSTDQTITQSDYKIDEKSCGALSAGTTHNSGSVQTAVNDVPAGNYYLGVITDKEYDIDESNENNNTAYVPSPMVTIPDGGVVTDFILEVPIAGIAPVIDGLMDPVWYSACTVPMEKISLDEDVAPNNWLDSYAGFKMMYDADNYYLFIQVHDDEINTSNAVSYYNDCIEIFFDGDNSKNNEATGYDDNDVQLRYEYGRVTEDNGNAPDSEFEFMNTDDGYNLEIRIPASSMTFNLNPDHTFGFDIAICDNDGGNREHLLKWWSGSINSWADPSLFGTARTTDYVAADPMYILRAPEAPTIDGVLEDDAWKNIAWLSDNTFVIQSDGAPLDPPFDITQVKDWNDCRLNYKMMWQGNTLYICAHVFDDMIVTDNANCWMNDGLQIYIDGNNDKLVCTDDNDGNFPFVYSTTAASDAAFTSTGSGYTFECQLDLNSGFGIHLYQDKLMGFELSLNDNDGGGRDLWSHWWSDDDFVWSNPSLRGTIQLAGLVVGVDKKESQFVSETFKLTQNYPNPFNPVTTIRYTVPRHCYVTLVIYNLLGRKVDTLVSEVKAPGEYSVVWNGQNHSAGIYLAHLYAGEFTETKKLILQK